MTTDWYYGTNGERHGPVAFDDLERLVASGDVKANDLAWTDGFYDWKPVGQVSQLNQAGGVKVKQPALPDEQPAGIDPVANPSEKKGDLSDWKDRASQWWSDFRSNAKAAGQLVSKQAEKTKLTTMTLPAAFRELGRHVFDEGRLRSDLTSNFEEIDRLNSELAQLVEKPADADAPQAISEKARAMAGSAKRTAQRKVIEQKLAPAYAGLGKTAFEQHGEACGPGNLVSNVVDNQARLGTLDAEISELSEMGKGQVVTPKRIAIGGLVVVVLVGFWGVSSFFGGGSKSNRSSQDAAIENPQEITKLTKTIKDADALWDEGYALFKKDDATSSEDDQRIENFGDALALYMAVVNSDGTLPDKATMGRVYGRAIDLSKNRSVAIEIAVKALRRDILPLCEGEDASDTIDAAKRQIEAEARKTDEWLEQRSSRTNSRNSGTSSAPSSRRSSHDLLTNARNIRIGMSPAQSVAVMGRSPDHIERSVLYNGALLFYRFNGGDGPFGFDAMDSVFVMFAKEGKPQGVVTLVTAGKYVLQ